MIYFLVLLIFFFGFLGSLKTDGKDVFKKPTIYFITGICLMLSSLPTLFDTLENSKENIHNALNNPDAVTNSLTLSDFGIVFSIFGIVLFYIGAKLESKIRSNEQDTDSTSY